MTPEEREKIVGNLTVLRDLMQNVADNHAEQFDITCYQGLSNLGGFRYAEDLETMHACGNTACVAGFGGLTPQFKAAGGYMDCGSPYLPRGDGTTLGHEVAIIGWLGLQTDTAPRWPAQTAEDKVIALMTCLMTDIPDWRVVGDSCPPLAFLTTVRNLAPDLYGQMPEYWSSLEAHHAVLIIDRCIQIMKGEVA